MPGVVVVAVMKVSNFCNPDRPELLTGRWCSCMSDPCLALRRQWVPPPCPPTAALGMEQFRSLPRYLACAAGAPPPRAGKHQVRWFTYLSKDDVMVALGSDVFYLTRSTPRMEPHFTVIGELRAAPAGFSLPDVVADACEPEAAGGMWADPTYITGLPICADIVVHTSQLPDWHIRDRTRWERLSVGQQDMIDNRLATLMDAPGQLVAFCLGADALLPLSKLAAVLQAFAQVQGISHADQARIAGGMRQWLAQAGFTTGLFAATEWRFPLRAWCDPGNKSGFAIGRAAHPNALWGAIHRRVVAVGFEGPDKRWLHLGLTDLGALSDAAVDMHNQGLCAPLSRACRDLQHAPEEAASLIERWPLFAAEPEYPVIFPADQTLRAAFCSALTLLARQRALYPQVTARCHREGCVCAWLPTDRSMLACSLCDPLLTYTGPKQLCDHLNGRRHRQRYDADFEILGHVLVDQAVDAVCTATCQGTGAVSIAGPVPAPRPSESFPMPEAGTIAPWDEPTVPRDELPTPPRGRPAKERGRRRRGNT